MQKSNDPFTPCITPVNTKVDMLIQGPIQNPVTWMKDRTNQLGLSGIELHHLLDVLFKGVSTLQGCNEKSAPISRFLSASEKYEHWNGFQVLWQPLYV